ncbi:hypothetical protein [Helicobacter sp.]|uniref:hypothetical protein n=1 Tax=Helicobacter sp. TaxID=218 RepID=UPI0019892BB4|nr:hypothetical protein [Helicobacter sp.]MBD5164924.1 hypothetical protein [Helicobacter sp.]
MVAIKHFIQFKNDPNAGKTTTILWCFLKFLSEEQTKIKVLKYLEYGDFIAVVERDGKTIGFISASEMVKKSYETLCKEFQGNIEICVFATRTHGHSVTDFKEILKENDKQEPDEVFKNRWIDMIKETQPQIVKVKDEISCHLQKQSEELANLIKEYL